MRTCTREGSELGSSQADCLRGHELEGLASREMLARDHFFEDWGRVSDLHSVGAAASGGGGGVGETLVCLLVCVCVRARVIAYEADWCPCFNASVTHTQTHTHTHIPTSSLLTPQTPLTQPTNRHLSPLFSGPCTCARAFSPFRFHLLQKSIHMVPLQRPQSPPRTFPKFTTGLFTGGSPGGGWEGAVIRSRHS